MYSIRFRVNAPISSAPVARYHPIILIFVKQNCSQTPICNTQCIHKKSSANFNVFPSVCKIEWIWFSRRRSCILAAIVRTERTFHTRAYISSLRLRVCEIPILVENLSSCFSCESSWTSVSASIFAWWTERFDSPWSIEIHNIAVFTSITVFTIRRMFNGAIISIGICDCNS